MHRNLSNKNIDTAITEYEKSIENISGTIDGKSGINLFHSIKREKLNDGPYPDVTLFEAANRIMTDLVILHGIKWLLKESAFSFDSYIVEYGNEDNNAHDIFAEKNGCHLTGEAFNVAKSFFQGKKTSMLKKLRKPENKSTYKIILANSDAVNINYTPKIKDLKIGEHIVFVNIITGQGRILPKNV